MLLLQLHNETRPTRKAAAALEHLFKQVAVAEQEESADEWGGMSDSGEEVEEDSDLEIEEEANKLASEPEMVDGEVSDGEVSAANPVVKRGVGSDAASNRAATKAKFVKTSRVEPVCGHR